MSEHTKTPWKNYRMINKDGGNMSPSDIGHYIKKIVEKSKITDFYFVVATKPDGEEYDVCHVGNGPDSEANARNIVKCVNAHDELVDALRGVLEFQGDYGANEIDMANAHAKAYRVLNGMGSEK